MPPETDPVSRSIRRWLRVIAFTLGVGLVTLANVGYVTTGYQDSLLFTVTGVVGGTVALVAGLLTLTDLLPVPVDRDAPASEE